MVTVAQGLREAQAARFAGLDPLLPPAAPDPDGDVLTAAVPSGGRVAGVLCRSVQGPGAATSLWSARDTWELFPLVGDEPGPGMDALLRAWRQLMDRVGAPDADSSCVVTWPSRDAEGSRALLAHGFQPLSVLAVRRLAQDPPVLSHGLTIRAARMRDLDAALPLALAELAYSAMVGGTIMRPDAADIKRAALTYRIGQGDPVWLAERDGVAIGLVECWVTEADPNAQRRFPVPPGRWGYINCVSVLPGARGTGVGQAMMAFAHRELHRAGAAGTYLYYNPPNPLSSVFWPRQGYRPLWTIWETRPAGALR
ncbi:MAG TPA: GNAT family N-acetyltransferase [Pseudonocardiaceae bacterium]|jgi:ribosomal protein S18 acetylase RimI-like enzyme|nr:GNAT family N-acetyltransferase [Pseudonocardiaceae bacterium]